MDRMIPGFLGLPDCHYAVSFGLQDWLGLEPQFGALAPLVPKQPSVSWCLGSPWGEVCCQWLCWHWPGALTGPHGYWCFCCCKLLLLGNCRQGHPLGSLPPPWCWVGKMCWLVEVVTSDLWGGDMVAVTVAVFYGKDCLDLQLDVSAIAWVRRLSTSAARLHLGSGEHLGGTVFRMMEALPIIRAFVSNSLLKGMSISR